MTWLTCQAGSTGCWKMTWDGVPRQKLGNRFLVSLFLTLTWMLSRTWGWCLLQVKKRVQNCFLLTLSSKLYLHVSLGELCPCLGSQERALVCERVASARGEKELSCLSTIQVTNSIFCGREASELFQHTSILKITFLELYCLKQIHT